MKYELLTKCITEREVVDKIGFNPRRLSDYRKDCKLPFSHIGNMIYYKVIDINKLMESEYIK